MKEPRYACLSEAKASHSHRMWTVSSSVPHFLQGGGLLLNPITYRCILRLCPVRRPVMTLDFVLLKESNRTFVARLGPEINFRACLWLLQGPHYIAKFWLSTQCLILLLIFCLETPRDSSGPINFWVEPPLPSLLAISFPHTLTCPGIQYSPPMCRVEYTLIILVMQSCGSSSFHLYNIGFSCQCKSTSLNAIQVKSRQAIVSMEEKLDVISQPELSEWIVDI